MKVYVVIETSYNNVDSWDRIYCVFSNKEKALETAVKLNQETEDDNFIEYSYDEWEVL